LSPQKLSGLPGLKVSLPFVHIYGAAASLSGGTKLFFPLGRMQQGHTSDAVNLSDVFSVSPLIRALPGLKNTPLKFLCQTQVFMFPEFEGRSENQVGT